MRCVLIGCLLLLVSLVRCIIGGTMGGLHYVVAVLQARTRGMTLMRMPLTIWGIFMATVLALLAWMGMYVFGGSWQPALPAMSWHAHEMVFGYGLGVIAGDVLAARKQWTVVQNLTGTPL